MLSPMNRARYRLVFLTGLSVVVVWFVQADLADQPTAGPSKSATA